MSKSHAFELRVEKGKARNPSVFCNPGDSIRVGSSFDSGIQLIDDSVDASHARLEIFGNSIHVLDLQSSTGIRVNSEACDQAYLRNGDQLELGGSLIRVFALAPDTNTFDCSVVFGGQELSTIGKYSVVKPIGVGGMGEVFLVEDQDSKTQYAMKLLNSDEASDQKYWEQLFERESKIQAQLDHPNIVKLVDFGDDAGTKYLVMEYVETIPFFESLGTVDVIQKLRLAVGIGCQILVALDFAHRNLIVHRDVKPANILTYRRNGKVAAKLSDFGLSKNYLNQSVSLTQDGQIAGSMLYIAPEQLLNYKKADPRCDIYSLAATIYEWICGCSPHSDESGRPLAMTKLHDLTIMPPHVRNPQVPEALGAVLMRALEADPRLRYLSAIHFRDELLPYTKKDVLKKICED